MPLNARFELYEYILNDQIAGPGAGLSAPNYHGQCHGMVVTLLVNAGFLTDAQARAHWNGEARTNSMNAAKKYLGRLADYTVAGRSLEEAVNMRSVVLSVYELMVYQNVPRLFGPLHSVVSFGNGLVAGYNNLTSTRHRIGTEFQVFDYQEITYLPNMQLSWRAASPSDVAARLIAG